MKTDENVRKPRVLLVRSCSKAFFAAPVARALRRHPGIEFMQYPRLPSDAGGGLRKLHHADEAWDDLHTNLVESVDDFRQIIENRNFDLFLLVDDEASLFRYQTVGSRIQRLADGLSRCVHGSARLAREHLAYEKAMPYTLDELSRLVPLVVIENRDAACLSRRNRMLFEASTVYFKRELPYDRFFMYYPDRPAPWAEWRRKLLPLFSKIHGIPLGIEDDKYLDLRSRRSASKSIDVFFSGAVSNTLRQSAADALGRIAARDACKVVLKGSVPFDEYCELVAQSKVTLSIAGSRWDCFRHYEAVALGSLPLMNRPTVDAAWWRGLPDEIFFDNSLEDFEARLMALVSDDALRERCRKMLQRKVEEYMLHSKVIDFIVCQALADLSSNRCMPASPLDG